MCYVIKWLLDVVRVYLNIFTSDQKFSVTQWDVVSRFVKTTGMKNQVLG